MVMCIQNNRITPEFNRCYTLESTSNRRTRKRSKCGEYPPRRPLYVLMSKDLLVSTWGQRGRLLLNLNFLLELKWDKAVNIPREKGSHVKELSKAETNENEKQYEMKMSLKLNTVQPPESCTRAAAFKMSLRTRFTDLQDCYSV